MTWSTLMEVHFKSFIQIRIFMLVWDEFFLQSSLCDFVLRYFRLNYNNASTLLTYSTSRTRKVDCCGITPLSGSGGWGWFHGLLNTKSPTVDPSIVDELRRWAACRPLDDVPSSYQVDEAIRSLENRKGGPMAFRTSS